MPLRDEMFLKEVYILVALFPECLVDGAVRHRASLQEFWEHPDDADLLVIGAIEDTGDSLLWKRHNIAPEIVVLELVGGGFLEADDAHSSRGSSRR